MNSIVSQFHPLPIFTICFCEIVLMFSSHLPSKILYELLVSPFMLHMLIYRSVLRPYTRIFLSTLFSKTFFLFSFLKVRHNVSHHYKPIWRVIQQNPWYSVSLKTLIVTQLVTIFPSRYGNQMFVTISERPPMWPYPGPVESNVQSHTLGLWDSF
jgi:hypothetical protein